MTIQLTEKQKVKILNSGDLFKIMQQVLLRENKIDRNKEHLWIVCLANNNRILMIELVSLGTVNKTLAEPMDIFSFALQKRAVKIILVHNHPSGELQYSQADYDLTEQMWAIGKFVKVPVIDHLIISETDYLSFADEGLFKKIIADARYDLTFQKRDMLLFEMKEMERKKKREMTHAKKEIAKGLLEKGVEIDVIIETTGLTRKQVEKLGLGKGSGK